MDGVDAGGDSGCVDVAPEPAAPGGGVVRVVVVVIGDVVDEPLLAVVLLLFQPATIRNPINSRHRDTGNPTPHSASGALIADHRIAEVRIGNVDQS